MGTTGTLRIAPAEARMAFGLNASAHSGRRMTPAASNAAARRTIVPTLPGSCTPSSATAMVWRLLKISSAVARGRSNSPMTPCDVFVSLIALKSSRENRCVTVGFSSAPITAIGFQPAVIAWEAGKDPTKTHLAIANFTGSLRLLVGLGWPMIYFVAAFFRKKLIAIQLDEEHSVEIFGLLLPILYFVVIWWKGTLSFWD